MISQVIYREMQFLFVSVLGGMSITLGYDILRIIRRIIAHGVFMIAVEDFLFWTAAAFWIFFLLYRENDGSIRLFSILAMTGGMLLYEKLFGPWFVRSVSRFLKAALKIFFRPLGIIWKITSIPLKKTENLFKTSLKYAKFLRKKLQNRIKEIIINVKHR